MKPIALFALAFVLLASVAAAQPQASPSNPPLLSQSLQGQAKEQYESGRLLAANGDFNGALVKFWQSYVASKDPRLLYNMAVCEKSLRHYARMQSLLEQYTHDVGPGLSYEERARVDAALAAIKNLLATTNLTANEAGATVLVDGESVGTTPLGHPLVLDAGKHTLSLWKPGFEPVEQTVDAVAGGKSDVVMTLRAQDRATKPTIATGEATADGGGVTGKTTGLGVQRWSALGAGALGVVGIGLGTAFGLVSLSKHNEAAASCVNGDNPCMPAGVDAGRAAQAAGDVSTVAFVAGTAALAGAVVLWFTAPATRQTAFTLLPSMAPQGVGPAVTGAW